MTYATEFNVSSHPLKASTRTPDCPAFSHHIIVVVVVPPIGCPAPSIP
jgi:hypothetical protein